MNTRGYNNIIGIMLVIVLCLLAPISAHAAETEIKTEVAPPPASKQESVKANASNELMKTGNDFLRFALSKAEKYSGKAEDAIGWAVDKAFDEAPKLVEEFLRWRFWKHAIKGTVPLALMVVLPLVCCYCFFKSDSAARRSTQEPAFFIAAVFSGIGGFVSMIVFFADGASNLLDALQIYLAPRIYVIEQLQQLLR